jgi:hypothetical protein
MWDDQRNIGCDATSNVEAAYSSKFIYLWKAEMKQTFEKIYICGYIYIRISNDVDCIKSEWIWLNFYIFHSQNIRFENRIVQSYRELVIMHHYSVLVEIIVRPPYSRSCFFPLYIFHKNDELQIHHPIF